VSVLVVAAHPDDEVLGCGGTIARLTSQGERVTTVILGEGATSRFTDRREADPTLVGDLRANARAAAAALGAGEPILKGLPDNRFDELPLLEVVQHVEAVIKETAPSVIYTHHPGDLNIDHQITFRAVLTATRPMQDTSVRDIYAFEVPSSTEWALQQLYPPFKPNVFVDISESLEAKFKALQAYENEMREFPHPRSLQAIQATAQRWGSVAGVLAAEAFELIRSIRRDA
jgi:LmbE family N-acetylglucosaminyl deacetylase